MVKNICVRIKRNTIPQHKEIQFIRQMDEYKLMNNKELEKYKSLFTNLNQVNKELEAVRSCLIQCEQPNFYKNVSVDEHKKAVAKFTQLFKALLELKNDFESFKGF